MTQVNNFPNYFVGICVAGLLASAGAGTTAAAGAATGATGLLSGICAAGVAGTAGAVGTGATTAAPSKTLPEDVGRKLPK
jgi:hypothetical protein